MITLNIFSTVCFGLAIIHTFSVSRFNHIAAKFRPGSVPENLFHLLGEIEVVFGIWAAIYLLGLSAIKGVPETIHYLNSLNFTEPIFVFVIMAVCSSKPILKFVEVVIDKIVTLLPLNRGVAFYLTTLTVGPLLGSIITEPAAMTVAAMILYHRLYLQGISRRLMYATIGLLFVNVSIGGTLTSFAAPPVLMVAGTWGWTSKFMLMHFGWKSVIAIVTSTILVAAIFRKELTELNTSQKNQSDSVPAWITLIHLVMLGLIVLGAHHIPVFVMLFLFFIGFTTVTEEFQSKLKFKEGLLVSFFLGGLVILGAPQRWWLEPLLAQLNTITMYLGAIGLTAVTDNAALTYLGSQVPNLSDDIKYALVSGAVVGGGLTAIANAPNPVGYGILNPAFGEDGISPLGLFLAALIPTTVAGICFWFL